MKKKYNYEDAWEDIQEFYGEEELAAELDEEILEYGDGDGVEFVNSITFDLVDENGNAMEYELVGRMDIEDRAYLIVHRISDTDASSVRIVKAWDNEDGELCVAEIEDEAEAEEVYERARMLLSDEDESWDEINPDDYPDDFEGDI